MKNLKLIVILVLIIIIGFAVSKTKLSAPSVPALETPLLVSGDVANFVSFSIAPGQKVSGEMTATGAVKGGYFFEANLVVKILNANKAELKTGHGTATTDWMTSDSVSFTTNLDFVGIPSGTGYVRIQNDNPSGDPANDKFIDIPVVFQ